MSFYVPKSELETEWEAECKSASVVKAKIAYLTSPAPDRFILNFQFSDTLGNEVLQSFEISKAHLANIIIDGTSLALREAFVHHREPEKEVS